MSRKWAALTLNEQDHLIWTMYAEARGEGADGMAAVAWVIRNRSNHAEFPNYIDKIVTRKIGGAYEFSPWGDGSLNRYYRYSAVYKSTAQIAQQVFDADQSADITFGATFFENKDLKDSWMESNSKGEVKDGIQQSRLIKGTLIGNHQFYKLSHYYYAEIKNKGKNPVILRDGSTYNAPKSEWSLSYLLDNFNALFGNTPPHVDWTSSPNLPKPAVPTAWHPPLNTNTEAFENLNMKLVKDIKKVQLLLERADLATDRGGADQVVDGILGSITREAIKRVEQELGKTGAAIDGIMDAEVWAALQDTARLTAALKDQNAQSLCSNCSTKQTAQSRR